MNPRWSYCAVIFAFLFCPIIAATPIVLVRTPQGIVIGTDSYAPHFVGGKFTEAKVECKPLMSPRYALFREALMPYFIVHNHQGRVIKRIDPAPALERAMETNLGFDQAKNAIVRATQLYYQEVLSNGHADAVRAGLIQQFQTNYILVGPDKGKIHFAAFGVLPKQPVDEGSSYIPVVTIDQDNNVNDPFAVVEWYGPYKHTTMRAIGEVTIQIAAEQATEMLNAIQKSTAGNSPTIQVRSPFVLAEVTSRGAKFIGDPGPCRIRGR